MTTPKEFTTIDAIEAEKAKYILNLPNCQIQKQFWDEGDTPRRPGDPHPDNPQAMSEYFRRLRTWLNHMLCNNCEQEHRYKFETCMTEGRRFIVEKFGIQSLQGNLRNFLCEGLWSDCDMENCHWRIFQRQVRLKAKEEGVCAPPKTELLDYYIANRETVLNDIVAGGRAVAKRQLLRLLNCDERTSEMVKGCKKFYTQDHWLKRMFDEKQALFEWLTEVEPKINEIPARSVDNPKSSKVSHWFSQIEDFLLMRTIRKTAPAFGGEQNTCPFFDGFFFRGGEEERKKVKAILDKGEHPEDAWFTFKSTKSDRFLPPMSTDDQKDYVTVKEAFEREYFEINAPYGFARIMPTINGEEKLEYFTESEMSKSTRHWKCMSVHGKLSGFFAQWVEDPTRRQYVSTTFVPYSAAEEHVVPCNFYNLFPGYRAKQVELEKGYRPEWFLDLIYQGLAAGNQEKGDYLIRLIACMVKHPRTRHRMAWILRGSEGVGKDTIMKILKRIFGDKLVVNTEDISECYPEDGFNDIMRNKMLVVLNEVSAERFCKYKEIIKGAVTSEDISIKAKYKGITTYPNYTNTWILSNRSNPVTLEHNQRRFEMYKVADWHRGDTDHWADFYTKIEDDDEIDRLYSWLICEDKTVVDFDLGDFDAYKDRPRTEETRQAETASTPVYIHWLSDYINDDRYKDHEHHVCKATEDRVIAVKSTLLCKAFRDWATKGGWLKEWSGNKWLKVQMQQLPGVKFDVAVKIDGKCQRYCKIDLDILGPAVEAQMGETVPDEDGNEWETKEEPGFVPGFVVS